MRGIWGMLFAAAIPLAATVLTFEKCGGDPNAAVMGSCNYGVVNQNYGDRASAESMNGGLFRYINDGEGWTPNVVASYGPNPAAVLGLFTGYRPLANVLWADRNTGILSVTLQADPGYRVRLYNFELAVFSDETHSVTAKHIKVVDQNGVELLNLSNYTLTDAETFFFFTPAESGVGGSLRIEFDMTNLPVGALREYLALDNIRFGQVQAPAGSSGITSPVQGSQVQSSTAFTWTPFANADGYWLDVGTAPGSGNVCASGFIAAAAVTFTCNGIPSNAAAIHVQLWHRIAGAWQTPIRYTYLPPPSSSPVAATLISPAPGTILTGTPVTFTWSGGSGLDNYWLDVGTAPGQGNIFGGALGGTAKTVTNLPNNGQPIYVRLWSHVAGGAWMAPFDYSFASAGETRAALLTPAAGSTFGGTSQTFTWSSGTGADGYWLDVGPAPGNGGYASGFQTTLERTVTGLPCTGQPVYARLWTRAGGIYKTPIDYAFTLASNCNADPRAKLTSPAAGSTVSGNTFQFAWSQGGAGTTQYWLDVGTSAGLGNISAGATATLNKTVSNLPANGLPLYVRLWTFINGAWQTPVDYVFATGSDSRAMLLSPAPGSRIAGTTATFTWSSGASGADGYWLDVGTSPGEGNLSGGLTGGTSKTVTNLPANGGIVFVRLWTRLNGVWQTPIDYTFTN